MHTFKVTFTDGETKNVSADSYLWSKDQNVISFQKSTAEYPRGVGIFVVNGNLVKYIEVVDGEEAKQ